METKEEMQLYLQGAYRRAVGAGKCRTLKEFSELIGVDRTGLSSALNGSEKHLTKSLVKKVRAFEDSDQPTTQDSEESILVIPTGARAGTLGDFADSVAAYDCERMISPVRGADYAMQITGDSMSPEYPSGSQIIIKKINENAFIEWGKVYVLDTENGAIVKQVRKTPDPNLVECVSLNPAYQPFTINTKYIRGWYRVLMVLSLK